MTGTRYALLLATASILSSGAAVAKEPVSVKDLAEFAIIGDPNVLNDEEDYDNEAPGLFSPDGSHVAVLVRRGNVAKGSNDGTLLVYRTSDLMGDAKPVTIAEFSSTTNGQPIALMRWLADNETLVFAGSRGGDAPQIFRANIKTRSVEKVTDEAAEITGYGVDDAGKRLILSANAVPTPVASDPECNGRGCRIEGSDMWAVTRGQPEGSGPLVVRDLASGATRRIEGTEKRDPTVELCFDPISSVSGEISPDGRWLLRMCEHKEQVKPWWNDYTASFRMRGCRTLPDRGCRRRLELIDLETGATSFLSDAPTIYRAGAPVWIDGGRYLILPEAVEPLEGVGAAERTVRAKSLAMLLFDPRTKKTTRIARLDPRTGNVTDAIWDARSQSLLVKSIDEKRAQLPPVRYTRTGGKWVVSQVPAGEKASTAAPSGIALELRQSLNERPVLWAVNRKTGEQKAILDPNPWLADRELGKVERFDVKSGGVVWEGALYFPPDYKPGKRYPLVMQNHGFDDGVFSMDGLSRNYAGRALASHGMIVLQQQERYGDAPPPSAEYPTVQVGWEATIDELDKRGLIDRNRIAIQGWSRSGPQAGYMLTQSDYPFAAAAFTSSADFGLLWYLSAGAPDQVDELYGDKPFGVGIKPWLEMATGYNLHRLRTPMLMWGEDVSVFWDWYALLRKLDKPVEYWTSPKDAHDIFQVPQRLRMTQLLVDWFRFWLKDETRTQTVAWGGETAESLKSQNERWLAMRKQQDAVLAQPRPPLLEWTAKPRGAVTKD